MDYYDCGHFSAGTCGTNLGDYPCNDFNSEGYCCVCGGGYTDVIAETEWYAPEKFYTLTKIQMWKIASFISGFKVFFDPETEPMETAHPSSSPHLAGLAPIEHMFGTTDLNTDIEELDIPKPTTADDLVQSICLEFKDRANGDATVLTGITLSNRKEWTGSCVLSNSDADDVHEWRIGVHNKGNTPHHKLYELNSRLVGFKMTTGQFANGNTYIR